VTGDSLRILQAAYVAPMTGPLLRDAAVVFAGDRIVDLGEATALRRAYPEAAAEELGNAVILPGLVNAHTHLELSACRIANAWQGTFTDWIFNLRQQMQTNGQSVEEMAAQGVGRGIQQCLRFGVTTVGDINQQTMITRPLLRNGPLRCVSYGEALGLAESRGRFEHLLAVAVDVSMASEYLRIGLSPHAPYTVDLTGYRQCLELARRLNLPIATHLAENPDERDFLTSHSGPFRDVWNRLGTWSDPVETFAGSPIEMAQAIGLLDHPTLLAHCNYVNDHELRLLARGQASVVYCPRTHAYFGHPPHRWRDMLAAGINVAVGTDSCASSPDLNLVEDLRLLHRLAPDILAMELWQMATIRAADAVQLAATVGSIEPGKAADLVAFGIRTDDPLTEILEINQEPIARWIDGQKWVGNEIR
jgi:cytosine/adenosine deaminase-related metal-dependent hydrolase